MPARRSAINRPRALSAPRRVAITGLGAVTALGPDTRSYDAGLRAGRSGIGRVTFFDVTGFRTHLGAQAPDPTITDADTSGNAPVPRPDRFGIQATGEALAAAGLAGEALRNAACLFGTGTGGAGITEVYYRRYLRRERAAQPASMLVPHQPCVGHRSDRAPPRLSRSAHHHHDRLLFIGDRHRLRGRSASVWATSRWLLAGGARGVVPAHLVQASTALRATAPDAVPPLRRRAAKGLNLGEGAGGAGARRLGSMRARAVPPSSAEFRRLRHHRRRLSHDRAASRRATARRAP